MIRRHALPVVAVAAIASALIASNRLRAAGAVQPPEQFLGFRVGADNKLARWDRIVEYMKLAASGSDRVRYREIGKTSEGNGFVLLEISSPDTLKNLDRYKEMERKLYFQGGAPSDSEREAIFRQGKLVLLVTCSIHATEVGASQMSMELVHRLATEDSPTVRKILDNVIFLLVPSANPDGQIMVTDWFNRNLGTPYDGSPIPFLYHRYAGHDNNRDMYMFTQKESQYTAQILWHDWFPTVWLDEHQMESDGPRIFVMPATDPINPNVHPLIYRWNGILGQSQAAGLEAAGKGGIIYNSMYTNFWEGSMAWSGWWHNQIGLLTEVASAHLASPVDQELATPGTGAGESRLRSRVHPGAATSPLSPPIDVTPRTEYPRPWLGGHWTLRDIVDYELIATMALLETAADRRETILRHIYEVNRHTLENGARGDPSAILVPVEGQHDVREAGHLVDRLRIGGVEVHRADEAFEADGQRYAAGTFVIPMAQVFARYAKDLIETQTYPDVRRDGARVLGETPYDVTAWSLGLQFGVVSTFAKNPMPASLKMTRIIEAPKRTGAVAGNGARYTFAYAGADTAIAINRLLKDGAQVSFDSPARISVSGIARKKMDAFARDLALSVKASDQPFSSAQPIALRAPRIALYQPWTGGNMDEGWTRWVLEQYEFESTPIHNAEVRAGGLRRRFDAVIFSDQSLREIMQGYDADTVRPEYRGGIGEIGVEHLQRFVADGGTLITLGAASDLPVERLSIPVRNIKRGLSRERHFAPGSILRIQVDTQHPMGYGMAGETYGFYNNSPFFMTVEGFGSQKPTVVARYPNSHVIGSGWLKGEELMAGRAAVVSVEMNPGRIVLFGLRPQHRAQSHATFPMLFNALYLSASDGSWSKSF